MPRIRPSSSTRRVREPRLRRRRFCLTYFGSGGFPPETFITSADAVRWNTIVLDGNLAPECKNLQFFVVQTERGSDGRLHYQAYAEFKRRCELNTLKAIFGDRVHVEVSRGNSAANIRYCTKNESRVTGEAICISGQWGSPKRGGDVQSAAIKILNGSNYGAIVDEHPGLCLTHGPRVEAFIAESKGMRTSVPKITILCGLTGCGKSLYCQLKFGTAAYWVAPPDGKQVWFGHYMCQDV